ncbi:formyl transferase [Rhodopirellula baltica]
MRYLVVGRRPWNRRHFNDYLSPQKGEWHFCDTPQELTRLSSDAYQYIFFLHWSDKVPQELIAERECICFHMTDVPYGRGGSPLQNLVSRGHRETVVTALRMTTEFDAGPVYAKRPLSLEGSTAEEIFIRASKLSCEIAIDIANNRPIPTPQTGNPAFFKRRRPADSVLPSNADDVTTVFDHIRMLDATGYPSAFLESGKLRIEFSRAALYDGEVHADVRITLSQPSSAPDKQHKDEHK